MTKKQEMSNQNVVIVLVLSNSTTVSQGIGRLGKITPLQIYNTAHVFTLIGNMILQVTRSVSLQARTRLHALAQSVFADAICFHLVGRMFSLCHQAVEVGKPASCKHIKRSLFVKFNSAGRTRLAESLSGKRSILGK